MDRRRIILENYAIWTAVASLRSGRHIKDSQIISKALRLKHIT
jgi:hypothetical protein